MQQAPNAGVTAKILKIMQRNGYTSVLYHHAWENFQSAAGAEQDAHATPTKSAREISRALSCVGGFIDSMEWRLDPERKAVCQGVACDRNADS